MSESQVSHNEFNFSDHEPRSSPDDPSPILDRLDAVISEYGLNYVFAFSGQGSVVHELVRQAVQEYPVVGKFLKTMCEQSGQMIDELCFESPSIKSMFQNDKMTDISANPLSYKSFWSTDESPHSFYQWAIAADQPDFFMSISDIQKCQMSFPLIAIASVIQVFYTCLKCDVSPFEVVKVSRGQGVTMIGHSQGILSSIIAQGLAHSPNKLLRDWNTDASWVPRLLQVIRISCIFGSYSALQSDFINTAVEYALMPLDKGALSEDAVQRHSCMLAVEGLHIDVLKKHVDTMNLQMKFMMTNSVNSDPGVAKFLTIANITTDTPLLSISLNNGHDNLVVSGPNLALQKLKAFLDHKYPKSTANEARIPYSQRIPTVTYDYLAVSVPFHSVLLKPIEKDIYDACVARGLEQCCKPNPESHSVILDPSDGSDFLMKGGDKEILHSVVSAICSRSVDFPLAHNALSTRSAIFCFGPGTAGHAAQLNTRNSFTKGSICVLVGTAGFRADYANNNWSSIYSFKNFMESPASTMATRVCMEEPYSYQLPSVIPDGPNKGAIRTSFTDMSGNHPVLIAGMTPCTSSNNIDLIVNALNNGYHCELAGGGLHTPTYFRNAVDAICAKLEPGRGIHLNILYLNKFLYDMHWPLVLEMKNEGYPFHSITFGAGSPSVVDSLRHIQQLRDAGFRYVNFKPGNGAAMAQVVEIASHETSFPIVVQWTGGQAGGHHSKEHQTEILKKYLPRLRRLSNVYVVCGGGVGDASDAANYFSGKWAKMPTPEMGLGYALDGVLIGSRACVASESALAPSIKQLIVDTEGIENSEDPLEWEKCEEPLGHKGIVSVKSELGEAIHILANRCGLFWKQLDMRIFDLPYDQRDEAVRKNKKFIIEGLLNDYQKPWFPINEAGEPIEFEDMTYGGILRRFADICSDRSGKWFDITYEKRFTMMMDRIEKLYIAEGVATSKWSVGNAYEQRDHFLEKYPKCLTTTIQQQDIHFFIVKVFAMPGKPVNFVPQLDMFGYWYKKDSLWQSEFEDSFPNGDPETIYVLMGPAAVSKIKKVESVKEILDGLNFGAAKLLDKCSPTYHYDRPAAVTTTFSSDRDGYKHSVWEDTLSRWSDAHPMHSALLEQRTINLQGSAKHTSNPFLNVLEYKGDDGRTINCEVSNSLTVTDDSNCVTTVTSQDDGITVEFKYELAKKPLSFTMKYDPTRPACSLTFSSDAEMNLNAFYRAMWSVPSVSQLPELSTKVYQGQFTMTEDLLENYNISLGSIPGDVLASNNVNGESSVVMVWPLIAELITDIGGDITRLVHLSHSMEWKGALPTRSATGLELNTKYNVEGRPTKVWPSANGVEVGGLFTILKGDTVIMELTSTFYIRQKIVESVSLKRLQPFHNRTTESFTLIGPTGYNLLKFLSNSGGSSVKVDLSSVSAPLQGERLKVETTINESGHKDHTTEITTKLYNPRDELVATLTASEPHTTKSFNFDGTTMAKCLKLISKNAVPHNPIELVSAGTVIPLENPITKFRTPPSFTTPSSMQAYALASRDTNIIHCSRTLSYFAHLDTPIVHGMWTYAKVKSVFESTIETQSCAKVEMFKGSFTAMVHLGETLSLQATLKGHCDGREVYDIDVVNQSGQTVMFVEARVLPNQQAVVCVGQGSAKVGMGSDIRMNGCSEAKAVWNQAERRFQDQYGISLIHIVEKNPMSYIVDLRGEKGAKIRSNLLSLKDGAGNSLLNRLKATDTSYRFAHPSGLLMATYFTQPAILINAFAQFVELSSKGVINREDSVMCGHSLGEYGALAMMGFIGPSFIVDFSFYRGLSMENVVPRKGGKSEYAMSAFSPMRVTPLFTEEHMEELVKNVAELTESFLEIANYNVPGNQYVLTGTKTALHAFGNCADELFKKAKELQTEDTRARDKVIGKCVIAGIEKTGMAMEELSQQGKDPAFDLVVTRGRATVPLVGIDVPFHSSLLKGGVKAFQVLLLDIFTNTAKIMNAPSLRSIQNRYIPNLTGKPFFVTRAYGQMIKDRCVEEDQRMDDYMDNDALWNGDVPKDEYFEEIAMSFFTNLLGNQLAGAVRWIETSETLLLRDRETTKRRREVYGGEIDIFETGSVSILANMLNGTKRLPTYTCKHSEAHVPLKDLSKTYWANDANILRTQLAGHDDVGPTAKAFVASPPKILLPLNGEGIEEIDDFTMPLSPESLAATIAIPPPMMMQASPFVAAEQLDDVSVPASIMLRSLIAHKIGQTIDDVTPSMTIKDISGGKSTLVNELAADLQAELAGIPLPNEATEMSIEKLSDSFAKYKKLGPVSLKMIQSIPFPAGFTIPNAKSALKTSGLGPLRADAALLIASVTAPTSRLADKAAAESYLTTVASRYATVTGVTLPSPSSGGGGYPNMMAMGSPMMMGGGEDADMRQQMTLLMHDVRKAFGDLALESGAKSENQRYRNVVDTLDSVKAEVSHMSEQYDAVVGELGGDFVNGVQSKFSSLTIRSYKSAWSWVHQDSVRLLTLVEELSSEQLKQDLPELFDMTELTVLLINKMTPKARDILLKGLSDIELYRPEVSNVTAKLKDLMSTKSANNDRVPIQNIVSVTKPAIALDPMGPLFTKAKEVPRENGWEHDLVRLRTYEDSDVNVDITNKFKATVKSMLAHGHDLQGKTVLATGCGAGSIGIEFVNLCLASGATVIATTSRDMSLATSLIYRNSYETYAVPGAELHVVPCNGASNKDVSSLVDYVYTSMNKDIDFVIPFAALPEKGKDITNIDSRCELAHRLMYTNVERLLGRVVMHKQRRIKERQGIELVDPAVFLLPCSPNHGIFGGDGLYAASKRSLEVLGNKCIAEGWQNAASIVNVSIGWTRGTSLMGQFDAISAFIENPVDASVPVIRTFGQQEMATYILACTAPAMVEQACEGPYFADFSGGLNLSPKLISRAFGGSFKLIKEWNLALSDILVTFGVTAVRNYYEHIHRAHFGNDRQFANKTTSMSLNSAIPILPFEDTQSILRGASYALPRPFKSRQDANLAKLGEMIDLRKVPVIVGNAEIGPFVNSRTRWEREAYGGMSLDTILELCLFLGYIKPAEDVAENDNAYWVNTEDGTPCHENAARDLFEQKIREKTGIRLLKITDFDNEKHGPHAGYDGVKFPYLTSAQFEHDSPWFTVASKADADMLRASQKEHVFVEENEDGTARVRILAGASLVLPAETVTNFALSALVPDDYHPTRAGLPKALDTIDNCSKITAITAADALLDAGIVDSWELFEKLHVSEVGNAIGGGFGGMGSIRSIFQDRLVTAQNRKISTDTFPEVFINSAPAWVNMLLVGSSGPIRPAVGACATAALSLENAIDSIVKGDARVMLSGATDDYCRASAYEFGIMGASRSSKAESDQGRSPSEASRPTSTTRGGFLEAAGSGICVVTDAEFALANGLPIRAIIPHIVSATDKIGRSIPAPGRGILTSAAEDRSKAPIEENVNCRYGMFQKAKQNAIERHSMEMDTLYNQSMSEAELNHYKQDLAKSLEEDIKGLQLRYGHHVGRNRDSVSKLRSALTMWGMTIDDITVSSFHGTSTQANDINESATVNAQMQHLGRSQHKPIHVVCQKSITGHPKGPAAQWMLNGAVQMLQDSVIPGNFNLDDVDALLEQNEYLLYKNKTIRVPRDCDGMGVKSVLIKSFGFGQVGAEVLAIHPSYLYRILPQEVVQEYDEKVVARSLKTVQRRQKILIGTDTLLQLKQDPVAPQEGEMDFMLDPAARRAVLTGQSTFVPRGFKSTAVENETLSRPSDLSLPRSSSSLQSVPSMLLTPSSVPPTTNTMAIGFDLTKVEKRSDEWMKYNFTAEEIDYCKTHQNPERALSGRWAAKEAVVKAIGNATQNSPISSSSDLMVTLGQASSLKEIEVITGINGATTVKLHGYAAQKAKSAGITDVHLSISYFESSAAAYAHAV